MRFSLIVATVNRVYQLDSRGEIDLYYLDETRFCLIPFVSCGWQNIGEYLEIPSRRSHRINVAGIMNRKFSFRGLYVISKY